MVRPCVCVVSGSQVCLKFATYRKVPWRLSVTRKANVRDRLKKVDAVIEAVRASGVQCSALVCCASNNDLLKSNLCIKDQCACLAQGT